MKVCTLLALSWLFGSFLFFTPAWGLPVVGRIDMFENGTTQGWGGSYSTLTPLPMNMSTGGPAGLDDGYMEISTNGFHLATRNQSRAWTGNFQVVGVKAISMDLVQLAGHSDVRLRLALFGPGGMFATVERTRPLNERVGWMHHTFHLGVTDLVYVPGSEGTGILADTLSKVTTVLIRHDSLLPSPPGTHPPHIKATVGLDNITAVLRDYDVSWEFGHRENEAYVLAEIEPSHVNLGELNGENPSLVLLPGQRYQIILEDPNEYPLELIAKGPTAPEDLVLLSMSPNTVGSFENDETVDWVEDDSGDVTFTLTEDLWVALQGEENQSPGYRCANHSQNMRGAFVIAE